MSLLHEGMALSFVPPGSISVALVFQISDFKPAECDARESLRIDVDRI